jgi:hypothetical protein
MVRIQEAFLLAYARTGVPSYAFPPSLDPQSCATDSTDPRQWA